jgi:recombination protein RecA
LLFSQPDTGEQALEIADTLVRSGAIDVLVIDSVAALTPRAELEGEMGDSLPRLHAGCTPACWPRRFHRRELPACLR